MPVRAGRALCPVRKWGEAVGFEVDWNNDVQAPLLDGAELQTEIVLMNGVAHAPIRDLVEAAGLQLALDITNHKILVTH